MTPDSMGSNVPPTLDEPGAGQHVAGATDAAAGIEPDIVTEEDTAGPEVLKVVAPPVGVEDVTTPPPEDIAPEASKPPDAVAPSGEVSVAPDAAEHDAGPDSSGVDATADDEEQRRKEERRRKERERRKEEQRRKKKKAAEERKKAEEAKKKAEETNEGGTDTVKDPEDEYDTIPVKPDGKKDDDNKDDEYSTLPGAP